MNLDIFLASNKGGALKREKYVINGIRENRFKYNKSNLVKQGFDSTKTEHEIMIERGHYRIYNAGNAKYIWNN